MLVIAEITEHLELRRLGVLADDMTSSQIKYQRWENLLLRCHTSTDSESMMHLSESFRYATLVHLLRRVQRLPHTDPTVQSYVHLTLAHIFRLDTSKPGFNATWPKMIAGLELDEVEYPDLAAKLLHDIRNTHFIRTNLCRNRSHDESEELLLSTWSQRSNCQTWEERVAVDWLDIATAGGRRFTIW
jgi:Fungal specific transcription factor domain